MTINPRTFRRTRLHLHAARAAVRVGLLPPRSQGRAAQAHSAHGSTADEHTPMTDGIRRRNVIREMQKRTIGEALYSKKIGRKPNASAKKIGVLPARQGQSRA